MHNIRPARELNSSVFSWVIVYRTEENHCRAISSRLLLKHLLFLVALQLTDVVLSLLTLIDLLAESLHHWWMHEIGLRRFGEPV